jgi:hypothetical protein
MRTTFRDTPRCFDADGSGRTIMNDVGGVELAANEQLTFIGPTGSEYDVARKEWGYYATPSLNGRLPAKGLRAVLARNDADRYYVCLVENGREDLFASYAASTGMHPIGWLDDSATLDRIARALGGG